VDVIKATFFLCFILTASCAVNNSNETAGASGNCEFTVDEINTFDAVFQADILAGTVPCADCHEQGTAPVTKYKFVDPAGNQALKVENLCHHLLFQDVLATFPLTAYHATVSVAITASDIQNLIDWLDTLE